MEELMEQLELMNKHIFDNDDLDYETQNVLEQVAITLQLVIKQLGLEK